MDENKEQSEIGRRNFLAISVISIAGLISIGLVVPSIVYIVGPALQSKQEEEWVRLGSKSKVETGVPTLFKVKIPRQTGWIQNEEELSVYVVTDDGRNYIALSNVCTHLGCRVRWITDKDEFFCPCHNGVFDKVGAVVSGPPPKPLDRYDLKIENDQIFIKVA